MAANHFAKIFDTNKRGQWNKLDRLDQGIQAMNIDSKRVMDSVAAQSWMLMFADRLSPRLRPGHVSARVYCGPRDFVVAAQQRPPHRPRVRSGVQAPCAEAGAVAFADTIVSGLARWSVFRSAACQREHGRSGQRQPVHHVSTLYGPDRQYQKLADRYHRPSLLLHPAYLLPAY